MADTWAGLHKIYETQDWIDKPSIFAETAITYFPEKGKILELGAGQGQDSRYFAEQGYEVLSTDIEKSALDLGRSKLSDELKDKVTFQEVDLREALPFENGSFDVVYAHLSLHYFNHEITDRLFHEIRRVLKPGGTVAFFVNSTSDPEYNTGKKIEENYFEIEGTAKRYFSIESTRKFTHIFEPFLIDDKGETYKDAAKGVHHLIRYIGRRHR